MTTMEGHDNETANANAAEKHEKHSQHVDETRQQGDFFYDNENEHEEEQGVDT